MYENYGPVRRKLNAQFGPKDPSQTVCNQLKVIQQKPEEELGEFATCCHQLATDAWGGYLHGGSRSCCCSCFPAWHHDSEAAWSEMQQSPQNMDDAFEYLQQVMHNWKLLLSSRNRTKAVQSVSFAEKPRKRLSASLNQQVIHHPVNLKKDFLNWSHQ